MAKRQLTQLIDEETNHQLQVLANVEDPTDMKFQGVGMAMADTPYGPQPQQVPFAFPPEVKTIPEAWEAFPKYMFEAIKAQQELEQKQAEEAAKNKTGLVDISGQSLDKQ